MALKAVGHPYDPFDFIHKESLSSSASSWEFNLQDDDDIKVLLALLESNESPPVGFPSSWESSSSPGLPEIQPVFENVSGLTAEVAVEVEATASSCRRKRRRTKCMKNKEEIENQRMTHIAVERNRRRQMNEYLAGLRSLMPSSYAQRGDQASIIGGAIDFVKELEQLLQAMETQKKTENRKRVEDVKPSCVETCSPLADYFTFSLYSTRQTKTPESKISAIADIEVTMVESHANLKLLTKKRPRQLMKIVAGLQSLRLSALHLSLTTVEQMVLHSISLRVEDGCHLNTVDEIAGAVNQMIHGIENDEALGLN